MAEFVAISWGEYASVPEKMGAPANGFLHRFGWLDENRMFHVNFEHVDLDGARQPSLTTAPGSEVSPGLLGTYGLLRTIEDTTPLPDPNTMIMKTYNGEGLPRLEMVEITGDTEAAAPVPESAGALATVHTIEPAELPEVSHQQVASSYQSAAVS